uniref:Uncharacterized protein n=1 Tax=Aplanochytrium stocchinoi TaxID=215587 RepID=A0A7S3PQE0_9STRA|mmetsp:Transcript_4373/g.5520  ORF Transcript_4373/g.5520 Transcript_4373/m.5520 type:complete len:333 (+) Transcript_4373:320-1318(+)
MKGAYGSINSIEEGNMLPSSENNERNILASSETSESNNFGSTSIDSPELEELDNLVQDLDFHLDENKEEESNDSERSRLFSKPAGLNDFQETLANDDFGMKAMDIEGSDSHRHSMESPLLKYGKKACKLLIPVFIFGIILFAIGSKYDVFNGVRTTDPKPIYGNASHLFAANAVDLGFPNMDPGSLVCMEPSEVAGGKTGGHCASVFAGHDKIQRTVKILDNGVETATVSDDPTVAGAIRQHVNMMKMMTRMNHRIHQHDPMFQMMFLKKWSNKINLDVTDIDGGVKVIQTSDDDCAIQLIHYHAQVVSRFVNNGVPEFLCKHEIPPCAMLQ